MTVKQVLAERARLRAEAKRAGELAREQREVAAEAGEQLRALANRRDAALRQAARTGDNAPLDELDAERANLERERQRALDAAAAATGARDDARQDVEHLHREYAAEFMQAAEDMTHDAHKRLAELRPAYDEAVAAWHRARREWATLARDLDELPVPPTCPLADAGQVFSTACRPATVTPATADRFEPVPATPRHRPGDSVLFEHTETGHSQAAIAGTELFNALVNGDGWQLVDPDEVPA